MCSSDLRPDNIMIDSMGVVKIIDFGSVRVAGVVEIASPIEQQAILGTALYTAPEYFLGEVGSKKTDLFALGVICYQMLSGRLPYGAKLARSHTRAAQRKLKYESVVDENSGIPSWVDDTVKKSVHLNPDKRYELLSEFVHDLRRPNKAFLSKTRPPLIERNPVAFWQGTSLVLAIVVITLLVRPG